MNPETLIQILGIGVPTVGSLAALGWCGWSREKRRRFTKAKTGEETRRAQLLDGASILRPTTDVWRRAEGKGQIVIAGAGGYFSRQLPYLLEAFARAGASDFVGPILYIDLDDSEQRIALEGIPAEFASRVVVVQCPLLSVGLNGCTMQEALGMKHLWWHDVDQGIDRWLSEMQNELLPAVLLSFFSSAGTAALLYPALKKYRARYPHSPIYANTILDHKTVVRQRFPTVRELYGNDDLVRGTIIADNTRHPQQSDIAIASLFAAMTSASWLNAMPLQMWNGMSYVFPKELPIRYATVAAWGEMIPIRHIPAWKDVLPEAYYTKGALVEEKILRGIQHVLSHPELQAVPLEPAQRGHTRLLYVIAPIIPEPHFRSIAERVDANLAEWKAQTDTDLLINYASLGTRMNPRMTEVPIIIVMLQPLATDGSELDDLAQGRHLIADKFLPQPIIPPLQQLRLKTGEGANHE
jgi:hypothetical protein